MRTNYCYECGEDCSPKKYFCSDNCSRDFFKREGKQGFFMLGRITNLRKKQDLPHHITETEARHLPADKLTGELIY